MKLSWLIISICICAMLTSTGAATTNNDYKTVSIDGGIYKVFESNKIDCVGDNCLENVDYIGIRTQYVVHSIGKSTTVSENIETSTGDAVRSDTDDTTTKRLELPKKSTEYSFWENDESDTTNADDDEDSTVSKDSEDTDEPKLACADGMCSVDSLEPEEDESAVTDTEKEDESTVTEKDDESTVTNSEKDEMKTTKLSKAELVTFFKVNTCKSYNSVDDTKYPLEIKTMLADKGVSSDIVTVTLENGDKIYMNEVKLDDGETVTAYCDGKVREVLTLEEGEKLVTKKLCFTCPIKTTGKEVKTIFRDSSDN